MPDDPHILLIRLSSLGDVLLTTPLIARLRHLFPRGVVDFLVDETHAAAVSNHPGLRRVYRYPVERRELKGLVGRLRANRYHLVIDLQHKLRSIAVAWACGAPRRLRLRKRDFGGLLRAAVGRDRVLDHCHAVDLYQQILEGLHGVSGPGSQQGENQHVPASPRHRVPASPLLMVPGRKAQQRAGDLLRHRRDGRPLVGIHPGGRWTIKRWPAPGFARLARELVGDCGAEVIWLGGPGDEEVLGAVRRESGVPGLADTLALRVDELGAAIALLDLVVTGDSAPMHLAAAVGTPVVAIFGPTSPVRWGPVGVPSRVVHSGLDCQPCTNHGRARCPLGHHRCLDELPVGEVMGSVAELLTGCRANKKG